MPHWNTAQWATAAAILVAAATLVGFGLDRIGKPLRKMSKRFEEFEGDWYGRARRPGFPATPGIPERLEKIEEFQSSGVDRLSSIEAQLRTNGGGTLRDEIVKIRDRLDEHLRFHAIYTQAPQPPPTPPSEGTQ